MVRRGVEFSCTAARSDRAIDVDRPELVTDTIRAVVEAVYTGEPLAQWVMGTSGRSINVPQ